MVYDDLPESLKEAINEHVQEENHFYGKEEIYYVEAEDEEEIVLYIYNKHGELIEREVEEYDADDFEDEYDDFED